MTSNSISCSTPVTRETLPFALQDVREVIPAYCFQPNLWRSLSYLFLDLGIITALYWMADQIDRAWFFPIFWVLQGTMFWALFVVGHDCGHGSFSRYRWLNHFLGHICHTPLLVPYHGWRISHRTHHANTGNINTDESWHPVTETQYNNMAWYDKLMRFHLIPFAFPVYLFKRSPGKWGSHFMPQSVLFRPHEKGQVLTSTVCCALMLSALMTIGLHDGIVFLFKYYLMPYLVFIMWLDLVTFLHHTAEDIPWYRGKEWYFLKGALSTIDHDYGILNPIHHNIGTHVAHHIFITIPHYHLLEATEAIKPVLGEYYREAKEPLWKTLWRSYRNCYFVPDSGSKVYCQSPQTQKNQCQGSLD